MRHSITVMTWLRVDPRSNVFRHLATGIAVSEPIAVAVAESFSRCRLASPRLAFPCTLVSVSGLPLLYTFHVYDPPSTPSGDTA
jgi:hypothetical protein